MSLAGFGSLRPSPTDVRCCQTTTIVTKQKKQRFPTCAKWSSTTAHGLLQRAQHNHLPIWSHFISRLLEISKSYVYLFSQSSLKSLAIAPQTHYCRRTTRIAWFTAKISLNRHNKLFLYDHSNIHLEKKPLRGACSVTCYITYHSQSHGGSVTNHSCMFHFFRAMRSFFIHSFIHSKAQYLLPPCFKS